jgi:hypothetical protein
MSKITQIFTYSIFYFKFFFVTLNSNNINNEKKHTKNGTDTFQYRRNGAERTC